MNMVKFSHDYPKMMGQSYGNLIYVGKIEIDRELPEIAKFYDTSYNDNGKVGFFEIEPGEYLQLVFLGNLGIPFTTYRKCSPNPFKDMKDALRILNKHYIGTCFGFKVKGRRLQQKAIDKSAMVDMKPEWDFIEQITIVE